MEKNKKKREYLGVPIVVCQKAKALCGTAVYISSPNRTLQYVMNVKLSKHRFWHCNLNGLIETIQTIPHNLQVSVKSASHY